MNLNAQIIEGIDGVVGSAGVAVVLYTILLKVVTYPLQQPALRTSALSQLLSPQVDELEKKFPLDEEARGKALRELYGNPAEWHTFIFSLGRVVFFSLPPQEMTFFPHTFFFFSLGKGFLLFTSPSRTAALFSHGHWAS